MRSQGKLSFTVFKKGLIHKGCVQWNDCRGRGRGGYEFTKLGKIPFGGLSLNLFNQIQEPLLLETLTEFQNAVRKVLSPPHWRFPDHVDEHCSLSIQEALTDLRIYRAQLKRSLSLSLYYLKIEADGETFYKIGVTQRDIEQQIVQALK